MTFIRKQKISFILHIFLELLFYCKDIVNLFWVVWTCLVMHTQSDTINLLKTFVFICRSKNQLHPPCFSNDWLTAFWPINRESEFCQIWDWWWNIKNNICFHFKFLINFSKNLKKLFWCQFATFLLKFDQKWIFMEKRASPVFKLLSFSNYLLMSHCWQKCWTDGWTDKIDFIRPSTT